ncbi:hypothetical protein EGM51_04025 [Verrucomicrobia bacterium S94]|nr:hypothetical protein EGM51_04025 [Verrucomicrobia bacterium S94]
MSFTRAELDSTLERIDTFDEETQEQLRKLDKMVPHSRLDTGKMHQAVKSRSINTPDKKRAFALMYMRDYFGMSDQDLPSISRSVFGKEMSDDDAFEWTTRMLEARHGESELKKFRSSSDEEKRNPLEQRMQRTRTIARLFGPTSYGDWSISDQDVADHERELENNDFATQARRLESVLSPDQERVGRFLAVTASPMDGLRSVHAMPEQDRGNVLAYVALLNPARDVGFWGQIAPRLRDAGKRSVFAIRRTAENFADKQTVLHPAGVFHAVNGKYPGGMLPDGSPLFDGNGGFASGKAREAVRSAILEKLTAQYMRPQMSYNMIRNLNQPPPGEQLDGYMDQVPQAYAKGRDGWELRGIERAIFHGAELDRFKKTAGEPVLQAMEMLVDMGAALASSAATQSVAGGIAYSYARIQSTLQDQLEYDYGVDHDEAFLFASIASAPYAAVEYAQIKGLQGAAKPAQKRFMLYAQRNWKGLLGETMKQRGLTTLHEIGEESAQSLIEQTMKAAAKEFADAEGVEYTELLGDWFDETVQAAKVMPFVMAPSIGADVTAIEIAKRGMSAGDPALLHEIGIRLDRAKAEAKAQPETDAQLSADIAALENAYLKEEQLISDAARQNAGQHGDVTADAREVDLSNIQAMQERARGAAAMVIVERQDDLPETVRNELEAVHGESARATGWYSDGKIYLVRENLDSEESAAIGWGHEQGHAAVDALGAMQELLLAGVTQLSGGIERIRAISGASETMSDADVVHEYIADLAAKQIDPAKGKLSGNQKKVWRAAVEWAQDWLGITTESMIGDRETAKIVRGLMERVFNGPSAVVKATTGKTRYSADREYTERESVVSVALRRLAGDDFADSITGKELALDRAQDNVAGFLNRHFPAANIPETVRRANEVVRMVEARADLLEMSQAEINQAVRQAEFDVRRAVRNAKIDARKETAPAKRDNELQDALLHNKGQQVRSLQAELRQRQQEVKRLLASKQTLTDKLKGQRIDIAKKMALLDEYIRIKTPAGASEIMKDAAAKARKKSLRLIKAASDKTRAKWFDETVADIDRIFTEAERRDAVAYMDDIIKNRMPKVGKNKVLRGDPLSPDQHEALGFVRDAWKVRDVAQSSEIIWNLQAEIEEMNHELDTLENAANADEKKVVRMIEKRDQLARKLWAYENFSDINGRSRSLAHVVRASKELTDLVRDGKTIHEIEQRMFRQERDHDRANAFDEFGGLEGYGTSATSRRKRSYDQNTPEWIKALDTFDTFHQSFEFLLDKFDQSGAGILGGKTARKFGRLAHDASVRKDRIIRQQTEKVTNAAMRIFGVKTKKDVAKLFAENSREHEKTGIFHFGEEMILSKNQAYKLWQLFQDETLEEALEKNGYTLEMEKKLEKFIGTKVLAWARWQLEEFYPEFYHVINPTYRKLWFVNMPFTENYSPVYRHLSGSDVQDMNPQQRAAQGRRAVTNMSVKARVANLRDFELMDGDAVLMMHIENMSHFVAWAEPMRLMNGVFRDPEVAEVIREHHGVKALQALNTQLNHFAAGGVDAMVTMRALDRFRARFTKAVIGLKAPIFFKQLSSIPAYAMDMPAGAWAKGEAEFWKNPKEAIVTLMQSDFMKDRYQKGHERDVVLALHSSVPKALAGAKSFTDKLMIMTQLGDAGAILIGGYPVYLHHYNLAKKAGKSDAAAKREALAQFEMTTRRTQQSGDVMDLGHFQRGGSIQKLLTMFSTSPISYYRSVSAGVRELARTRGKSKEAWKRVFIGHFLLPMLFQFIASGFRWDEEDQLRAALLGSMNRLFLAGDIADAVIAAIISHDIRSASGLTATPFGDIGQDVVYAVGRLSRELDDGEFDLADLLYVADKTAAVAGKATGIPYEGGRNTVNGVMDAVMGDTEYPLRRSVGYTPYVLDE